ncbi:MAG TPA: tetratricopeptide repeat protein [Steroidobacteraceae bacterium]|nr:tetratricopeptide repeat protein [Steroidobacteraceae bacterium]
MRIRHFGCMTALAAFSPSPAWASANCQLQQIGVLPVNMQGLRPIVAAKINGVNAGFVLDSGAFYSIISRDAAAQYQLPITPPPRDAVYISGVGGTERAQIATVKSFEFLGIPLPKVGFFVVNGNPWGSSVGSIGQNLLRISDVEYDLANGIVRFIKPVGCKGQPLAYWAVSTPYSVVDLKYIDVLNSSLRATAMVNGHSITVKFDTGSSGSLLSLDAAARAGITTGSPGVKFQGLAGGVGPAPVKEWIAPVATFQIGGEKVEHTHLLIGDLRPERPVGAVSNPADTDMLLGEDFFLSHRIYVAYSQSKLYFTYNGGPLFNLNLPQVASSAPPSPASPGVASQKSATTGNQSASDVPNDADGFRRRGMAYASMREFDRAVADLTRACELAPRDEEAHYDRGVIYAEQSQFKSALKDFNAAITLQPNDIETRVARAELLQGHPDAGPATAAAEAKVDLDKVNSLAPPTADVRLTLSYLYAKLGDYSTAIDQINQWLSYHRLDNDQAVGLNDRCRLRATTNRDLREALDDCNHALALRPHAPATLESRIAKALAPEDPDILDSRGLVYLRLGNLKDAVRDYDLALDTNSNMPTSLYGRGLAELRLGEKTQGQQDLAAAEKLNRGIAKRFADMGLAP